MLQPLSTDDEVEISDNGAEEKTKIMEVLDDILPEVDVFKAQVLIAIFQREKASSESQIITSIKTQKEDVYQGRVGLVLKLGPAAFEDNKDVQFYGKRADPGDWVFYVPANGTRMMVNGIECRILEDVHVDGKVVDPYIIL